MFGVITSPFKTCAIARPALWKEDATLVSLSLSAMIRARRTYKQAHQQLKQEFGLDLFEGRPRPSLHRYAPMSMNAYVFL